MSFPTFRVISSTLSNPLVVEVCPRAGARYLVWMDSKDFTAEWKEKTRAKILAKENAPRSPLIIPSSIPEEDEPYTSDCYESDPEDKVVVNYDEEFDSQWMPKVDLTQYEQPRNQWVSVTRRKKISPVKLTEEDMNLVLAEMYRDSPKASC